MKRHLLPVFTIVLIISCHDTSSRKLSSLDSRSIWLLKNEDDLNSELNKRIVLERNDVPKNAVFKSATITILKGDSSASGEFAKLIADYNPCILVSYTFSGDTTDRKTITLFKDTMHCTATAINTDTLFTIDSTKHFTIKIDSLLSGSH